MAAPPRTRLLVALLAALLLASGCATGKDAVDQGSGGENGYVPGSGTGRLIAVGQRQPAPTFGGSYLGGGSFQSGSLSGQVVVLNFWGSWCPPCRLETPEFDKVYQDMRGKGVQFLGVAVRDTEQGAQAFYTNKKISFRTLFDPTGRVALAFQAIPPAAIPSTVILDRHGRVAEVHLGAMLRGDLQPVLDTLLAES
jgi:peroxiredoxin